MRVITGSARGKKLITLEGTDVRPTSDMVKEAIFSIVQFELAGAAVLDLFAGSGQLGIEALSRGASLAVFVDSSTDSVKVVRENLKNTGLAQNSRVVAMDSFAYLGGCKDKFDVVFLDPPYSKDIIPQILPKVVEKLNENGIIVCEHDKKDPLPEEAGDFCRFRTYSYGRIALTTYRKKDEEE